LPHCHSRTGQFRQGKAIGISAWLTVQALINIGV